MMCNHARYQAFGIDFQSELALPELRVGDGGSLPPVVIQHGTAARPAKGATIENGVVAGPGVFWMDVPDVVRLRVEQGLCITVELSNGATESNARAYLLGSALGALLHQRGLLAVHASAVEINGRAVAFAGHSGAGKSTLALALTERGHRLLCDDIVAIDTSGPLPVCWPGLVNVKVWSATLAAAGRSTHGLEQVLPALDKYRLPIRGLADYHPVALAGCFGLATRAEPGNATVTPLGGAAATAMLIANTFRGQLVGPMQRRRDHFDQCVAVANTVTFGQLERTWNLNQLDELCRCIEASLMT